MKEILKKYHPQCNIIKLPIAKKWTVKKHSLHLANIITTKDNENGSFYKEKLIISFANIRV